MPKQGAFLRLAILVGLVGITIGAITLYISISDILTP
ncbi:hypothetical protein NITUZ_30246 [Candidatus Nitrosotenuis uzonensis]|nr:hypothetical protein NITUZ_30246 [Candidatus Nitrosotenuis uzonensis]